MGFFSTIIFLFVAPVIQDDDALGLRCPNRLHIAPDTWQLIQGPEEAVSFLGRYGRACVIFEPSLMEHRLDFDPLADP